MSAKEGRAAKAAQIRELLANEGSAVYDSTTGFNQGKYESVADLDDYEELKTRARSIKEDAIDRLPALLDELEQNIEANGGTVYRASDAADARSYICDVAGDRTTVKSKSMTSEEIEINEALEVQGGEVWETDLGEFVLQIADEEPSHIVAPAIHRSREAIAALFNKQFDPDPPLETAEELTAFAREYLGDRLAEASVGITGANFLTADSGTMALVTSEGNARKVVQSTDTHVAIAGVEKVIPTVADLQPFVELIARSGTGQDITSYVSLLTPPVDAPTFDSGSERDFHLVLLDNGRLDMREDEHLEETLYCIRCSACANSCANFQHVGGHAFGGETYSGGIATGWEAGVHGQDSAAEFNDLCTGCTRCVENCPVGIDIPWINTVVRDRINRDKSSSMDWLVEGLTPDQEPGGVSFQKRLFGNIDTLAKLGSATAPVSNWIASSRVGRWGLSQIGITPERALPAFVRETLVDWHEGRDSSSPGDGPAVVLYPDLYTNYVEPKRGRAAVRVLEALGCDVEIPSAPESGRAPLSQGMIQTATQQANGVADQLEPYVDAGRDIVVIEPSDLAMFRRDYGRLLDEEQASRFADHSFEIMEYVYGLLENGADPTKLPTVDGTPVAVHSHCQARSLKLERYTETVLEDRGFDVWTSDVECCGMAGSFGYKQEYYELSAAVGDSLVEQIENEAPDRRVLASGISCRDQLADLGSSQPDHPVEAVDPGATDP